MPLPKTILVPTDFSEASNAALEVALDLAAELGASIVLLHSFEIPMLGVPDGGLVLTPDVTSRVLEGAKSGLDREVGRYTTRGVPLRSVVDQAEPWRSIVTKAEELGVDLIVMGTHGRRGLPRALLGSVAEKVVRTSPVPVMTVHPSDRLS